MTNAAGEYAAHNKRLRAFAVIFTLMRYYFEKL